MHLRTFLATLPMAAAASSGGAAPQPAVVNPNLARPDVRSGDRITGASFA